jgi:hypothetical protein
MIQLGTLLLLIGTMLVKTLKKLSLQRLMLISQISGTTLLGMRLLLIGTMQARTLEKPSLVR